MHTPFTMHSEPFLNDQEAPPPQPRLTLTGRESQAQPHIISVWRLTDDEQIADLLQDPTQIHALFDEEGPEIGLDRAWHGLHYLLTGTARATAGPRGYILGGQQLGEVPIGYGPARGFTRAQAAAFDDLLQCLTAPDLRRRFDAQALIDADVYPNHWDRALTGEEDLYSYLYGHFLKLREFVAGARRDGMGLLTYLA